MNYSLLQTLIAGALIAASGGLLGSFALLRRMALVGDVLSHVALPGIALGVMFHFSLFLGSLAFLIAGILMVWLVEHKTKLPVDTVIGIFFTLALAAGAILIPREDLLEALFGDITRVGSSDFYLALILSLSIIATLVFFSRKIILTMISKDLSLSAGFKPHMIELLFLLIFALSVAIGIKFTGALLMGSLIIIPAATARNIARSMKGYMWLSAILGMLGAVLGILASNFYNFPPGPTFVIFAAILFFISIFFRK